MHPNKSGTEHAHNQPVNRFGVGAPNQRVSQPVRWTRRIASGIVLTGILGVLGAVGVGCLTRPVTHQEPTTKTNFTAVVRQAAVDKLDLLFMIDNSASMGDK